MFAPFPATNVLSREKWLSIQYSLRVCEYTAGYHFYAVHTHTHTETHSHVYNIILYVMCTGARINYIRIYTRAIGVCVCVCALVLYNIYILCTRV